MTMSPFRAASRGHQPLQGEKSGSVGHPQHQTDPAGYEGYKKLAGPAIEACGGRNLVRGGKTHVPGGEWHPERMVVLGFDSVEKACA